MQSSFPLSLSDYILFFLEIKQRFRHFSRVSESFLSSSDPGSFLTPLLPRRSPTDWPMPPSFLSIQETPSENNCYLVFFFDPLPEECALSFFFPPLWPFPFAFLVASCAQPGGYFFLGGVVLALLIPYLVTPSRCLFRRLLFHDPSARRMKLPAPGTGCFSLGDVALARTKLDHLFFCPTLFFVFYDTKTGTPPSFLFGALWLASFFFSFSRPPWLLPDHIIC